jgi:hypothetical protein
MTTMLGLGTAGLQLQGPRRSRPANHSQARSAQRRRTCCVVDLGLRDSPTASFGIPPAFSPTHEPRHGTVLASSAAAPQSCRAHR